MIKYMYFFRLQIGCLIWALCMFASAQESVDQRLAQMTLDAKLAQLVMIGFNGTEYAQSRLLQRLVSEENVGGLILFDYDPVRRQKGRNIRAPEQLRRLTRDIAEHAAIAPFIAIDEEGGKVTRLTSAHGFARKPSARKLGTWALAETYRVSELIASELLSSGISINFAPVVDVDLNAQNPVIGRYGRSFSSDPEKVTEYAREFLRAHQASGIVGVLKHFPGHGSSGADSHKGVVDSSALWQRAELLPYQQLIDEGYVQMIMSAHIFVEQLDAHFPATLSKPVLTNLLRHELGYRGLIVSDDMDMKAIRTQYGQREAMALALEAGVDILLYGNGRSGQEAFFTSVMQDLKALAASGRLSVAMIDDRVRRILALKAQLGLI